MFTDRYKFTKAGQMTDIVSHFTRVHGSLPTKGSQTIKTRRSLISHVFTDRYQQKVLKQLKLAALSFHTCSRIVTVRKSTRRDSIANLSFHTCSRIVTKGKEINIATMGLSHFTRAHGSLHT